MNLLRKYWYLCALPLVALIITLSFVFGGWVGKDVFPPSTTTSHLQSRPSNSTSPVKAKSTPAVTVPEASDVALVIPSIGVHAPIEPVGKSAAGFMEVPSRNPWTGVGWYQYGSHPGETGSAVVDGHLDRPGGAPAVFWKLHTLQIGSTILVVQRGKKTLTFRVVEMTNYDPQQAPLARIFGNTAGSFLNLITCAGVWLPQQQQTTLRLVVYSVLVS